VDQSSGRRGSLDQRREAAGGALAAFRERRRQRRGEDTWFGSLELLADRSVASPGDADWIRRRSELLEEAEGEAMPIELAELLWDVAQEEGLDPSVAYELVRTGLGVCPPEGGVRNAVDDPTMDRYLPAWIFPPEPTDKLLRERTLRMSFRRLRGLLETHEDVDEAFRRFGEEPDVGLCGY
jgi:hypothetical protein